MTEPAPTPNSGKTLADTVAMGPDQESQPAWLKKRNIKTDQRIKLTRLSHTRYQHPDLDEIHAFLLDFGLRVALRTDDEVWYKGYGPDQTSKLPGAGPVQQLKDAPGGGFLVTVMDPEGYPVNVVWGQEQVQSEPASPPRTRSFSTSHRKRLAFESSTGSRPGRRLFIRWLGHFGLCTQKFNEQLEFYTSSFNIFPTDFVYVDADGQRVPVTVFMHLDLGQEAVDHHSFFLSSNPKAAHVHHSSFEVHDFDAQQLGHQWLAGKGYRPAWGIGRHVLGSQIFDYWWDVSGNMVEHYADGDQVNEDTPIGYMPAGEDTLAVWGPKIPGAFLE
ncbi:Glyoxalase/Bleomycin resistance protein/Dihydroxybiphenyl dioxygenase [Aspergillus unguis]